MITNGYATLAEARDQIVITSTADDPVIEDKVEDASRAIDQFCQRHFFQVSEARVFVACNWRLVRFGAFNDLTTVTSVKTDEAGDGTFETTWDADDYQLEPRNTSAAPEPRPYTRIRAVGAKTFPRPSGTEIPERVEITGTWGWAAIPHAVREACLLETARLFHRRKSPEGDTNFGEFGPSGTRLMDPDARRILKHYRQSAVLVA